MRSFELSSIYKQVLTENKTQNKLGIEPGAELYLAEFVYASPFLYVYYSITPYTGNDSTTYFAFNEDSLVYTNTGIKDSASYRERSLESILQWPCYNTDKDNFLEKEINDINRYVDRRDANDAILAVTDLITNFTAKTDVDYKISRHSGLNMYLGIGESQAYKELSAAVGDEDLLGIKDLFKNL